MAEAKAQPVIDLEGPNSQAVELAAAGEWDRAAAVNREILASAPNNVEAWNRLGRALMALDRNGEAVDAYEHALRLDANNRIARKNLDLLQRTGATQAPDKSRSTTRSSNRVKPVYSSTPGTSIVTPLVRQVALAERPAIRNGQSLVLKPSAAGVRVLTEQGAYLGSLEPRLSARVAKLIQGGNQYAASLAGVADDGKLAVQIVETHRSRALAHVTSFPPRFSQNGAMASAIDRFEFADQEDERERLRLLSEAYEDEEMTEGDDGALRTMIEGEFSIDTEARSLPDAY